MNRIAEEILSYYGFNNDADILEHYGMPRRSGRYAWGSGKDPYQHSIDFLGRVDELRKSGFTYVDENGKTWTGDTAIAKSMDLSTNQFRTEIGLASDERRMHDVARVKSLISDGYNPTEIGRMMGKNESTIRSYLNEKSEARMNQVKNTAAFLKKQVDEKGMIDVGTSVERELGITSKEKLNQALYLLEREGYPIYKGGIPQATNPGQQTNQRVLCVPGTEHKEIYNYDKVHTIKEYTSRDDGETFSKFVYPKSMDSKRLKIRYDEDGGTQKDGIVELRRGVDDLSLGDKRYAQVRILVDGTHYIKGMAVYSDDMPAGFDVVFNSNKKAGTPLTDVLKPIKDDPDNPFGSLIKANGQSEYIDKNGKKQLSLINKRADEGDWSEWKDALPSQFLAKQPKYMAEKQLALAKADELAEYDEICSLENPTIKKHLLDKFASSCDSAAVNLQAAALPNQKYHVIIPVNSLKETEVYAPKYENGTKLALIRYPHGGTFEIPILTVNNKHKEARQLLGTDIPDAIAIHSKVAEQLSGADFDGDTVMAIPTHDKYGKVKIQSTDKLKGLEGFDPKYAYPERPGMKYMKNTGTEMGIISNLITDMTLSDAPVEDLAKAVRHSMVVIDAEKKSLDYKQSELDNEIALLKKTYQKSIDASGKERYGGASTLLSRSKGEQSVDKRQGTPKINVKGKEWYDPNKPEGSLVYKKADDLYYPDRKYNKTTKEITIRTIDGKKIVYNVEDKKDHDFYNPVKVVDESSGSVSFTNKTGDIIYRTKTRTQPSTRMAETDDANTLVSIARHPMELVYADYANSMKALANRARMEKLATPKIKYQSSAKAVYQTEVDSLMSKLNTALLNTTRERAAQRKARAEINRKVEANPDMKPGDIKKISQQAVEASRHSVGAIKRRDRNIDISDREWQAIQSGAVSETTLIKILNNTDIAKLRELATPRTTKTLSKAQINRIKALSASNYTLEEIAKKLGMPTSTVSNHLKGVK